MSGFTDEEWERATGDPCPRCQELKLRFRPEDGLCISCGEYVDNKRDRDEERKARLLRAIRAHNTRVDRRKEKAPAT